MKDGVGGDNVSWRWRTGRTVQLGCRNVHTWQSQEQNECCTQSTASDSEKEKNKGVLYCGCGWGTRSKRQLCTAGLVGAKRTIPSL